MHLFSLVSCFFPAVVSCQRQPTVQFHSIGHGLWPATQNTNSAIRQPTNFDVTPPKIWHSRRKISKILPFLHLQGRFGPNVSGILHLALGAVAHDRDQNSLQHRGCVMHDHRIEWNSTVFDPQSVQSLAVPCKFDCLCVVEPQCGLWRSVQRLNYCHAPILRAGRSFWAPCRQIILNVHMTCWFLSLSRDSHPLRVITGAVLHKMRSLKISIEYMDKLFHTSNYCSVY
jgi:hypothetical protein